MVRVKVRASLVSPCDPYVIITELYFLESNFNLIIISIYLLSFLRWSTYLGTLVVSYLCFNLGLWNRLVINKDFSMTEQCSGMLYLPMDFICRLQLTVFINLKLTKAFLNIGNYWPAFTSQADIQLSLSTKPNAWQWQIFW